ncbi:MAG TPA: HAD-IIIC family phosphatase [Bryobacteraceae bacterium]|nr:HAD-IIIC family phosphatase [Bryobacteraceae bacterium]
MPPYGRRSDDLPEKTAQPAIAVSATFTAEALQPALAFWVKELGLEWEIRFAPYNQLFQQLLDPSGVFARNRSGLNVALVRFEDWLRNGGSADLEGNARRLVDALHSAAASFASPLLVALCPPTPEHKGAFAALENLVRVGVTGLATVHLLTPDEVNAVYPVDEIHDPHADELGHLPYTPVFFAALATAIARKAHAIVSPPYKVAALDCDETLWAGICGEDGPEGVVIDPPRFVLQQFFAQRRSEGLLLALCSKNNDEDVADTFHAHPEMPLALDDFAARHVNWEPKSANLAAIAEELGLGLDSFVLVDDDAKECTEAQAGCPEVLALALPEHAEEIPEFLRHVWAFDRARVTEEDRRRSEMYAQQAERTRLERSSPSLESFLVSLRLEVRIAAPKPEQFARVAQLTARTNQMNATGLRRSEAEIQELLRSGGAECLVVEVTDRFGSYGLTGVMIFRNDRQALAVDTFLLSCRALGRGVEHRMVARLGEIALERGLARVDVPFVSGRRNRPAQLFLESLGKPEDGVFHLQAAWAAQVRYRPSAGAPPRIVAEKPAAQVSRKPVDYARIARDLRDPAEILRQVEASTLRAAPARAAYVAPRSSLERELVEMWAALLNLPAVGVHDSFFDLGGHSLLAVQLLSRVRRIYGVELSLEVVYSGEFTVAELAKAMELKEIEQAGGDCQEILAELESLSDEEVRALLAGEQDAAQSGSSS